jgi:hypothetical protein
MTHRPRQLTRRSSGRTTVSTHERGEKGDTLIEVLLAVVVLGLASVALIIAFGTSISASADHRNLTTVRTLLASASQQAIGEMQQTAQQALFASCNAGPGTVGSPYTTGATAVSFSVPPSYSSLYSVQFVAASGSLNPVEWWNATSASFQPTCPAGYLNGPQLFTISVTQTATGDTYYNSFTVTLPQDSTKSLVAGTGCQATNLQFVTQPGPSPTPANTPLGQFTVAVNCANGAPLANDDSQVVLTLSGGTGAALSCNPSSEINGYVYFTGCAVNTAGTYTIAASDPSDTQIDPTFQGATSSSFTIGAAGLKLVFSTPPVAAASGLPFTQSPVVEVENALGVVQVAWTGSITITSSGGTSTNQTLNCGGTPNSYTGMAVAGILTLPGSCTFSGGYRYNAASQQSEPTSYTLTATGVPSGLSLTVTPGTSGLFSVTSFGMAKQLVFSTEPIGANGAANALFTTQPAVTIEDLFGNVVSNSTASVTLTSNPSASTTLQCDNNTVSAVKGLATFTGCNETNYGNNLTLSAASSGLTGATSTPFNITPIPNLLVFTQQPVAGASGSTLAVEPIVDVYYSTNSLPSGTLSLVTSELPQITLTPSAGGLLTTCSGLAPNAGIVTIHTCAFAGIVGTNYTITASLVTSSGTITVTSNTISPTVAGVATTLQFTTEPSPTVISGTTFAAGPVVTIYDTGGNVVTASTALVTLTSSAGGSLPSQCASLQAVSGVVDGTSCAFTGPNSNNAPYTLTASSQGLTNATSSSFISLTPPLAPATPGAAVTNATSVALTWTAPANGGVAISGYQVNDTNTTTSAVGTNVCPSAQTSTSLACTVSGLITGDSYTFTVAAINSIGTGAFSTATTAVSLVTPGIPLAPSVTVPSATSAALTWAAPSDNGPAITGYQVNDINTTTSAVGTNVCVGSSSSTGTTCTISGLITGDSYTFTVAAINVVGTGTYSPASSSISLVVPGVPTGVAGTSNANTQSVVSWTAPAANGGPSVNTYTVQYSVSPFTTWSTFTTSATSSPVTVTGLTNGTAYEFRVSATNTVGTGPYSTPSAQATPATLPGAPTGVTATSYSNASAPVSWLAPASNGGATITGYTVTSTPGGFTCTTSGALTCTVNGLTNGTSYTFTVTATNAVGTGPASAASAAATPATLPGAPTGVTATSYSNASAPVSWLAPASNGGATITGYTVTSTPGGFTCTTSGALTCTVNGLTNGTSYTFTVTATNGAGTGPPSAASAPATPATVPGAPTIGTASSGGNTTSVVTWTDPASNGGATITGYTVTASPGGNTCNTGPATATSCTVTGLMGGTTYTFTVFAFNVVGNGPPSGASNPATPVSVPGVPTGVSATSNANASSVVTWVAPAFIGGSAITSYTVTSAPGGFTCTTATLTCTVGGLTNGTSYTFTVIATNGVGAGQPSAASAPAIPATVPGAPTAVLGSNNGVKQNVISWTAPVSNGGSAITSYTVTSAPGGFTCATATLTCTVTGLANFTAYTFTVTATNAAGTGPASAASASYTTANVPGAPTAVLGSNNGVKQNVISWTAPVSNGGSAITSYTVTSAPGGFTCTTATLTCTVTGLANFTAYTFTVTATNAAGTGPASAASASYTTANVPGAPTAVLGSNNGVQQNVISWTAPVSNGGSAITSYTVTSAPGGFTCATATLTCTVTGLANFTAYTFTVTATNAAGTGPASAASASYTTANVPGAPQGTVTASKVAGQTTELKVAWTNVTAANDGGAPITGYTVRYEINGGTTWTYITDASAGTPYTVTGLSALNTYVFQVAAINGAGTGAYSASSNSIAP